MIVLRYGCLKITHVQQWQLLQWVFNPKLGQHVHCQLQATRSCTSGLNSREHAHPVLSIGRLKSTWYSWFCLDSFGLHLCYNLVASNQIVFDYLHCFFGNECDPKILKGTLQGLTTSCQVQNVTSTLTRHWWSKFKVCVCIHGHPICVFKLKHMTTSIVHLKNKSFLARQHD